MCDTYNGWSNYQTWVFNLWFDDYFSDVAEEIVKQYQGSDIEDFISFSPTVELAQHIKNTAEEFNPIDDSSVWSDLMGYSIGMIGFYEIAEHYIDEVVLEQEEEGIDI